LTLALGITPSAALAWGAKTHELINRRAAQALTGPAGDVWRPLARALGEHANVADDRKGSVPGEARRHFVDADALDRPPFAHLPRTLDAMKRKYGQDAAQSFGSAPWAVDECYRMLVLSLRRGDWGSAGAWAADLGHYVGDTHQPLHCTSNYDGQRTGNSGVHLRFEVDMMDRYFREESIELPASLPDPHGDPLTTCFTWVADAFAGVEPILAADTRARAADPSFGDAYYAAMWEDTQVIASRQVSAAVRDLAALYQAAWVEAGSPPGPPEPPSFRPLPVAVLEGTAPAPHRLSLRALGLAAAALTSMLVVSAR
jgi:hypothetical protein